MEIVCRIRKGHRNLRIVSLVFFVLMAAVSSFGVLAEAMSTVNRAEITDLKQIPNIGPSIAANLRRIGISSPQDLSGKDPYAMYDKSYRITGARYDPCPLDVFIAATRLMSGEPAKPWWKYTPERKRAIEG